MDASLRMVAEQDTQCTAVVVLLSRLQRQQLVQPVTPSSRTTDAFIRASVRAVNINPAFIAIRPASFNPGILYAANQV
jgi:hypothetical protein